MIHLQQAEGRPRGSWEWGHGHTASPRRPGPEEETGTPGQASTDRHFVPSGAGEVAVSAAVSHLEVLEKSQGDRRAGSHVPGARGPRGSTWLQRLRSGERKRLGSMNNCENTPDGIDTAVK